MAETKRLTGAEAGAELARLEKTASPAPWTTVRDNHINLQAIERLDGRASSSRVVWSEVSRCDTAYVPANRPDDGNADAALIVAARNALPRIHRRAQRPASASPMIGRG
jgi:hypothetical protein